MAGGPFSFGKDVWDPTHRFETSWLLSPWALFFFRALFVRCPPALTSPVQATAHGRNLM